jgi:hypothetical protein
MAKLILYILPDGAKSERHAPVDDENAAMQHDGSESDNQRAGTIADRRITDRLKKAKCVVICVYVCIYMLFSVEPGNTLANCRTTARAMHCHLV